MSADLAVGRAGRLLGVAAMLLAACVLAGCMPADEVPGAADRADDEFQAGAGRPPTAKTLHALAAILATQGRDSESESLLRRTVREYPRFLPAYCDLAKLQVRQRRINDAVRTLTVGLAFWPKDGVLLNDLGMCHMLLTEYTEALALFTRASASAPQNARYRANMATALGMLGRYDEALALYEQVIPPAEAHYNVGVLCEARKDMRRAAEEFKKAEALEAEAKASAQKGS